MSLASRLLGANPSIQVSTLLTGSLLTPSAELPENTSAYEFINGYLLESNATTVTFSSIPSTYRALMLRVSARTTGGQTDTYVRYNGDSSAIYADHLLTFNPSSVNAFDRTGQTSLRSACLLAGDTESQPTPLFGAGYMLINDYSNASKYKSSKSYAGFAGAYVGGEAQWYDNIWASNSVISSIVLSTGEGNFVAGSRFNLYGVN